MIYYNTLDKKEKLKIKQDLLNDESANKIYLKINRVFIFSIIGFLFSIGAVVFDLIYQTGILNYILDFLLFTFCGLFIFKSLKMKNAELNKYILKKKNTKKNPK